MALASPSQLERVPGAPPSFGGVVCWIFYILIAFLNHSFFLCPRADESALGPQYSPFPLQFTASRVGIRFANVSPSHHSLCGLSFLVQKPFSLPSIFCQEELLSIGVDLVCLWRR